MLTGIDHCVILVPTLADGIRDYEGLGFTVIPGGEHPGGTHNALIAFADGAYIELIAFQNPTAPSQHRWHRYLAVGGGLVDFALGSTDLAADLARLTGAGLPYTPMDGARARLDGVQLQWRSASVSPAGQLPFLIEDVTPRGLRVPSGAATTHANGVTGILSITVAVNDLTAAQGRFTALFDAAPLVVRDNPEIRAHTATYVIGQHSIEVAQPADDQSLLAAPLTGRGDGPYSACLTADPGPTAAQWLDESAAHGARLQIVAPRAGE
ncbi:MAG: VOC family protein [Thermomicrobia bacterium]|nr:VOC family protein [Thermomicrobia bacterium]MCA1722938.1 VOC family protein [Thermomicrobia bacterium]